MVSRCPERGPRRAALTLRTEPGAEPPEVPDDAGKGRRPRGCTRRGARCVRRPRERAGELGSAGEPCSAGSEPEGTGRAAPGSAVRRGLRAGKGAEREPITGAADRGAGAAAAAAGKNESARESGRERERETGRARRARRGEAAGGAGAPEHEGAREPQPLSPAPVAAAAAAREKAPAPRGKFALRARGPARGASPAF